MILHATRHCGLGGLSQRNGRKETRPHLAKPTAAPQRNDHSKIVRHGTLMERSLSTVPSVKVPWQLVVLRGLGYPLGPSTAKERPVCAVMCAACPPMRTNNFLLRNGRTPRLGETALLRGGHTPTLGETALWRNGRTPRLGEPAFMWNGRTPRYHRLGYHGSWLLSRTID